MELAALLTADEIAEVTGCRQKGAQVRFLKSLRPRLRYIVNAAGRPVIARAWFESWQQEQAGAVEAPDPARRPNLRAIPGSV